MRKIRSKWIDEKCVMLKKRGGSLSAGERRQCGWRMTEKQRKKIVSADKREQREKQEKNKKKALNGEGELFCRRIFSWLSGLFLLT